MNTITQKHMQEMNGMIPTSSKSNASSIATLYNIGNTCYLNSVLYTLRFAPQFLHNLHHLIKDLKYIQLKNTEASSITFLKKDLGLKKNDANSSKINLSTMDAEKLHQQLLTEKLHELYQNLHCNENSEISEPLHTETLLNAMQKVNTIFDGNEQQDAHEFLICILNSIRETCITVENSINNRSGVSNGKPTHHLASSETIHQQNISVQINGEDVRKKNKLQNKYVNIFRPTNQKNNTYKDLEIPKTNTSFGFDFFKEDFEGITVSTTKCLTCESVTELRESMIDIAIPVPILGYEKSNDIKRQPNRFIENSCITRELFCGVNKYRCEQCVGYTEAIRSISYEVLPRLLIIQLNRFSGGMEKISSYIPTPFVLDCFCKKCGKDADNLHVYKLYSVITHVGATMSVGHYIAYTCSLDWANEYKNCSGGQPRPEFSNTNSNTEHNSSYSSLTVLKDIQPYVANVVRKRKKLSCTNNKQKMVTNRIEKLSMDNVCCSAQCCSASIPFSITKSVINDKSYNYERSSETERTSDDKGKKLETLKGKSSSFEKNVNCKGDMHIDILPEAIWYMCDDDKIKTMTQTEFQQLLSPSKKSTVTPYLLFYARFDLQSTPVKDSRINK